eukprot:m.46557 g.46557  ORF g.46557 m.46557 type:complete len:140 (-) comp7276_c0_seq1:2133-2552(-)
MFSEFLPFSPSSSLFSFYFREDVGTGRCQVALKPKHSLMDWIALCRRRGGSLAGKGVKDHGEKVTKEELKQHNNVDNGIWTVIQGRVYNITPYIDYHPGGKNTLMQAAGRDGTRLFTKYHAWVNAHTMLEKCYIGAYSG